jgi:hypothetical protein
MVKRILNRISQWLLVAATSFILLEVSLHFVVKAGLLNIIIPTYQMNDSEDFLSERSFVYGHRHQPNSTYRVKKYCTDQTYRYNSQGFRDEESKKTSRKKRVIALGDSFMEGLAVEKDERFSDLLEERTSIKHLNFGMADKGSTQSFVIYDSIASKYDHDAVLLSLFPQNDLIDDDPNFGKNLNSIRPCWIGEYPIYKLAFVPEDAPAKKHSASWKHFLKSYTYTYDALFYLKESIKSQATAKQFPKIGYFDYSEAQLNRMKYSLLKLKQAAGNKPLIVLCIPSHLDLQQNKNAAESIERELSSFCLKNSIEFIGMFDRLKSASSKPVIDFYYECDSHWNYKGHKLAFQTLMKESSFYQKKKSGK